MSAPAQTPQDAYRRSAVERFATLDDLDHLLEVSPPRRWLALAAVALLVAAALAWGVWGSLETRVRGHGIAAEAGAVLYLSAADAGRVRPGMPARVTAADAPGKVRTGHVATVGRCAPPGRGASVPVCIQLRPDPPAAPGGEVAGSVIVRRERPISFVFPVAGGGAP